MFVIKYCDVKPVQFVGSTRPVRTKDAARKFSSVEDANRVMKLLSENYGDNRSYMVLPYQSTGKKVVLG
jgi:hypothetical protein